MRKRPRAPPGRLDAVRPRNVPQMLPEKNVLTSPSSPRSIRSPQGLLRSGSLACAHPPRFTAKRLGTARRGRRRQKTVNGQENPQPEPRTSQQVGQALKHLNFGCLHPGLNKSNRKVTTAHLPGISFLASVIFDLRCRCSQQLNVQREGGPLCSHLPKASTWHFSGIPP